MSKADFQRITIEDLQLGEPVPWDIYDANEKLLVRQGFIPQNERQLEKLIERGLYANAEEYRKVAQDRQQAPASPKMDRSHVLSMLGQAHSIVQNIILGVVAHEPLPDTPGEVIRVTHILDEVLQINKDIALASIIFKQTAQGYTSRHLMDAGILSMLVAKAMQLPPEEISTIAAAALTMNLGMLDLQEALQNREEPPSEEEKVQIRNHPAMAVELLQESGVTDQNWLALVLNHHESIDGSGYPAGKSAEAIPEGAKIIAMADRYTAMIAPRKFRKAMHPSLALKTLLAEGGKTCDAKIAAHLVKELGVYPPGCYVKLANYETAIVMRKGATAMTPTVLSIRNTNGADLPYPYKRDTATQSYAIREGINLEAAEIQFNMQQLWGSEAT